MQSKSNNKKKILFIIYLDSQFVSLLPLIKKILKTKKYEPIVLFADYFIDHAFNIDEAMQICSKNKIAIVYELKTNYKKSNLIYNILRRTYKFLINIPLLKYISASILNPIADCFRWYFIIKNQLEINKNLFNKIKPDLIILSEENAEQSSILYTATAKKYSIPSVIVPHTIANQKELAEIIYKTNEIKGFYSKLAGFFFPHWIYYYKKRKLLLSEYSLVVILELFNLSPQNPWIINDGFSDAIAVESKFMERYYLENQIPKAKLVLTGSVNDDLIYQAQQNLVQKKQQFKEKYKLDNKPVILCAIPSKQVGRKMEFKTYESVLDFWVNGLKKIENYNIVYHLHPHTSKDQKNYMQNKDLKIVDGNIAELIPLCDLFVASVSATIRWAIVCCKPVINYDLYKYRYYDYDSAKGVVTIEKKEDFERVLKKITTDKKYYQDLKEKQEKCAFDWGMLDGKSGERIIKIFDDLVKKGLKTDEK